MMPAWTGQPSPSTISKNRVEGNDNFVLSFVLALVLGDLGGSETQVTTVALIPSAMYIASR